MNPACSPTDTPIPDENNNKLGPELFIMDWLSRHSHKQNKDEEICGMDVRVDTLQISTDIPKCMSITQIQQATMQDEHLQ